MSWTVQFGLWLAHLGGWQEARPIPPEPCAVCPPLKKTVEQQAILLAQKEAELIARPQIMLEPPPCPVCAVTQQEKATLLTEAYVFRDTIKRLEQTIADQTALLRSKLQNTQINPAVLLKSKELVQGSFPAGMGSEAKRHTTYANLIKAFPDANKRELSLAIEMALQS